MRKAEKEKKKFKSRIPFILYKGKKIPKKIAKKFKNHFPALFQAKTGWDRLRKGEKNFSSEFHSHSTRARKFLKKLKKIKTPPSGIIFSQNGMRLAEKEKKKIVWKSVRTRPEQENFEENSKKIKKIKKPLSGIISSQNGMR